MLPRHSLTPPVVAGYELSPEQGWYGVVLPAGAANLVTNPSVELGTTGYASAGGAALARSADWQTHGAYSLKVSPSVTPTSGAYFATVATQAGVDYTFSLDFQGAGGVEYTVYWATAAGAPVHAGLTFRATGQKQRVAVGWHEVTTTTRRLYFTKAGSPDQTPFYVDGLQVEETAYATTYLDGDQQGFTPGVQDYFWTGAPHASTSYRIASSRAGGRIVNLLELGLGVTAVTGLGNAAPDNVATQYGLLDGAYYQRTVIPARQFALVGQVSASNVAQLQRQRAALVAAFRHDSVAPDQPLLLVYQRTNGATPAGPPRYIPCVYSGGLEGNLDNLYQEKVAVAFTMFDPYVLATVDAGAALSPYNTLTVNAGLWQGVDGLWNRFDVGGPYLRRIASTPQGIFLGFFTPSTNVFTIYQFDPNTGALTTLGASNAGAALFAMHVDRLGNLFVGGSFTSVGGVASVNAIYYVPSTGTWTALPDPGFVVRDFTDATTTTLIQIIAGGENSAGTAGFVKSWAYGSPSWSAIGVGTVNGSVYAVQATDQTITSFSLYVGGSFTSIYGNAVNYLALASYTGTFSSIAQAATGIDAYVSEIEVLANGNLLIGGGFTHIGGEVMVYVAQYNRQFWFAMDGGLGAALNPVCQSLAVGPDGLIYAVSPNLDRNTNGDLSGCGGLIWNGQTWTPNNWLSTANEPRCVATYGPGRVIFGNDLTTNVEPGVVSVNNPGSARAFPVIRLRYTDTIFGGYVLPYVLQNLTTGARITFKNVFIVNGEIVTLDTNPVNPSLVSSLRGDITYQLSAGSDLAGFALQPGQNYLALLQIPYFTGAAGVIEGAVYWRPRDYGQDNAAAQ